MQSSAPFHISRRSFICRASATAAATGLPLWFVERELAHADEANRHLTREMRKPYDSNFFA